MHKLSWYYINYTNEEINKKINTYENIQYNITNKLQQLQNYINEEINKRSSQINTYENIQNNIAYELQELQNNFKLHILENNRLYRLH